MRCCGRGRTENSSRDRNVSLRSHGGRPVELVQLLSDFNVFREMPPPVLRQKLDRLSRQIHDHEGQDWDALQAQLNELLNLQTN